jgi:hypothetical protein
LCMVFFFFITVTSAQLPSNIHGNFEFNGQYYLPDSAIGSPDVPEKFLNNGFANFIYEKDRFTAGVRYESYRNPLLGFDSRYSGSGFPYKFLTYRNNELEITVGNFYDQFGSGIVFRSYEERGLGYDNAMEGIRIRYSPVKGLTVKGMVGKQRDFFTLGEGIVRGADAELNFNEAFTSWATRKTTLIIGGSFVSKFQKDDNNQLNLPPNVGSGGGRVNVIRGPWNIGAEFVYKANDPSFANGYNFKEGTATLLNLGYSVTGFGFTLQGKRVDNMSFRSDRNAVLNSLLINYLPAMTRQHTYLLASIFPYATQPNGEYGFQGEVFFHIKEGSFMGGQKGATLTFNYSRAQDIQRDSLNIKQDYGYRSDFLKFGKQIYFEDFNIEYNVKMTKKLRMILTYIYLNYNRDVIEGRTGNGHIYSHLGIAEFNYKISPKYNLRTELQHLYTKQGEGNWALFLAEFSVSPSWFIGGFWQANYGNEEVDKRFNYYNLSLGYTRNANRITFGYGRQRAGLFCVGGVCRTVPASNGFNITVTSSF